MPIFSIRKNKLERVSEISFRNEKEIQSITEANLKEIFGLEFVKSEATLGNLRIDTLAFDNETRSFVIIEYKRDKNFSVIDQGYAYLALLLNNKADFILEYNECKNNDLKRGDIKWPQSRVIFVSPEFTNYQRQAINFKNLPIELWKISKYKNNIISYNKLKSPETSESISKLSTGSRIVQKVSREIKVYTLEDHRNKILEPFRNTFDILQNEILALGDVEEGYTPAYIKYYVEGNPTFCDIYTRKKHLVIQLRVNENIFKDPEKLTKDISHRGWSTTRELRFELVNEFKISNIIKLIKQAFDYGHK